MKMAEAIKEGREGSVAMWKRGRPAKPVTEARTSMESWLTQRRTLMEHAGKSMEQRASIAMRAYPEEGKLTRHNIKDIYKRNRVTLQQV